jgi:hypothetical protein
MLDAERASQCQDNDGRCEEKDEIVRERGVGRHHGFHRSVLLPFRSARYFKSCLLLLIR